MGACPTGVCNVTYALDLLARLNHTGTFETLGRTYDLLYSRVECGMRHHPELQTRGLNTLRHINASAAAHRLEIANRTRSETISHYRKVYVHRNFTLSFLDSGMIAKLSDSFPRDHGCSLALYDAVQTLS